MSDEQIDVRSASPDTLTEEAAAQESAAAPVEQEGNSDQGEDTNSIRESLYERIGAVDDPDAEEEANEDELTPEEEAAALAEQQDEEQQSEEQQGADEQQQTEEQQAQEGEAQQFEVDESMLGDVPAAEWRKLPAVTKDRIKSLRKAHKQAKQEAEQMRGREPEADYGRAVIDFQEQNKIDPQEFDQWMALAPVVAQGGDQAIKALQGMLSTLGVEGTPDAEPSYPAEIQQLLDDGLMSEKEAANIAKHFSPATEQPAAQSQQVTEEQITAQGRQDLGQRMLAAQQKYGSQWGAIRDRVAREMQQHKGVDPRAWGVLFDQSLKLVVQQMQQPAKPPPRSLSPSTPSVSEKKPKGPYDDLYRMTGNKP